MYTLQYPIWKAAHHNSFLHGKCQRVRLMMINLPLGLAWAAWYGYEMISFETARGGSPRSMIVGLCVGFVVGLILGLMMLRKMQQANDIVIRQIKEMKDL